MTVTMTAKFMTVTMMLDIVIPHDVRASQTQTQVIQFMVKSMVKTERLASLQPGCGWAAYQGLELRISARRKGCVSALRIMRIPYPWFQLQEAWATIRLVFVISRARFNKFNVTVTVTVSTCLLANPERC